MSRDPAGTSADDDRDRLVVRPARDHPPVPTAFASREPLTEAELRAGARRPPDPARLRADSGFAGKRAKAAAATLGLQTVGGLLEHLPTETEAVRTIASLVEGERSTLLVEVRSIASRPVRRRGMRPLVQARVADGTGTLEIAFFNQPWLVERYRPGTRLMVQGTLNGPRRFGVSAHAPTQDAPAAVVLDGGDGDEAGESAAVARYPATEGLTSTEILARVREHRDALQAVGDPLPAAVRHRRGLADRGVALAAAHLGDHEAGRRRLALEELLLVQLAYLRRRAARRAGRRAVPLDGPPTLTGPWRSDVLPFSLTGDQDRAIADDVAALRGDVPLQRLLMGEVGSGKTVVALHAMLRAAESGHQAALMAPTETLAVQHLRTIQALLPDALLPVDLLTGSVTGRRRRELLARLADGSLPLVVGTHALIEEPVVFRSLALAVVDEQHRFGVDQRARLDAKASRRTPPAHAIPTDGADAARADLVPHVLHMSATPIPRTLALLRHGDLDVSLLRELPSGRRPITTHVCESDRERARAYARIREEVAAGRRAFVVCPLVADSEALEARSAEAEHERLATGELRDCAPVLLHGQMKPAEKQAAMDAFASGTAHVLVATTVIEVGIDVPEATVMVVENAERFGISQLHQLRGRVGRGPHDALCLLFGPRRSPRLQALARHRDGFALADVDLELRGEGELLGTRQSGAARLRTARLPDDADALEDARAIAEELLAEDPGLEDPRHAPLRDALLQRHGDVDADPIPG